MEDAPSAATDTSHVDQAEPSSKPGRRIAPGLMPPRRVWLTVLLCAAAIAIGRFFAADLDVAVVNVATLILAIVATVSFLIWFVRHSRYPAALRYGALCMAVSPLLLLIPYKIVGVDGSLVPKFARRGAAAPDALLTLPQTSSVTARTNSPDQPAPGTVTSAPNQNTNPSDSEATSAPQVATEITGVDLRTTTPNDMPRFLGRLGQPLSIDFNIETDWAAHPPEEVWRRKMGAGWSSFSVVNGFAVTLEQRGTDELVSCYRAADGELMWWDVHPARHETILGGIGPRSTPTIHEGRVYATGATGLLRCLDGATGKRLWDVDLLGLVDSNPDEDLGRVAWGRSSSPLIVDDTVVVPVGGKPKGKIISLAAFDLVSGDQRWSSGKTQVSYASPILANILGQRQIVSINENNVTGHNPTTGDVLWIVEWDGSSTGSANVSQPIMLPDDRMLLSKGYGGGVKLVQFSTKAEKIATSTIYHESRLLKTKFTNGARHGNYIFALSDGILECVDWTTGERQWKRGRYGHGQVLLLGDSLLVQTETGEVVLLDATADGHHEVAQLAALTSQTWNNPTLYGDLLLLRNSEEAVCYRLRRSAD